MVSGQNHKKEEDYEAHLARFFYDFDDEDLEEDEEISSDGSIERVIKELLHNSKRLDGRDVTVEVDHGDVTLRGTVRNEEEKYAAGSLVQLIHGVGFIKNEIVVKLNEGILPSDIGRKD